MIQKKYVEPIETGAIIPSELPQGTKFDIVSVMIQLLNLKEIFVGLPTDDVTMHIISSVGICTSYNFSRVSQKAIRRKLFSFSLAGDATCG